MSAALLHLTACTVDLAQRLVRGDAGSVRLTAREAELLRYLWDRRGETVPREQLLVDVWGYAPQVASRAVDATAARLRAKIERDRDDPDHLLTVHGVGYCFVADVPNSTTNVGSRTPELIGRATVLRALAEQVRQTSLLTIVGPPGVGKTTTARVLAARSLSDADLDAPQGVWFCDCTQAVDLDGIVAATVEALNMGPMATTREAITQIGHALAGRGPSLVVFDNFEQVAGFATPTLAAWLAVAPEVRFVVTSREPLHIAGERVFRLPPLEPEAASELFLARARDADHPLEPTDLPIVGEIVQRLDRLPLAIELAAARLGILAPKDLLARLHAQLDLLRSPRRDFEPRQSTLRGALDWSWDLLSEAERWAWVQCSVFRSPFTLDAAEAVIDVDGAMVLDLLQALQDKSLLRIEASAPRRHSMLESIAAYAVEKRSAHPGEWAEVEARHAAWFAQRVGVAPVAGWVSALDDLLAAARHGLAVGELDVAARAILGADLVLKGHGPRSVTEDLATRLLGLDPPAVHLAPLHGVVAGAMQISGRFDAAKERYEQALSCVATGDHALRAQLLTGLGQVSQQLGDLGVASAHLEAALALATGVDLGWAQGRLGVVRMRLGALEASREVHQAALVAGRTAKDAGLEAFALTNLVAVALRRGALDEGANLGQQAVDVAHAAGDLRMEAIAAGNLGALHATAGRGAQAATCYARALELHRAAGNLPGACSVLSNLGDLELSRGNHGAAEAHLHEARALSQSLGARRPEGLAALNLGLVAIARGEPEAAVTLLTEAIATFDAMGIGRLHAIALSHRGEALGMQAQIEDAQRDLDQAVASLDAVGDVLQAALSRCRLAQIHLDAHRPERARELVAQARSASTTLQVDDEGELVRRLRELETSFRHP